ncbi:uncharacterized protein BCR38DRAFT_410778 [Pseudomassariella vexata]|uniref:Uncharacterized protein n=1 Tax=Pseudomassariella vexata TaxID=1141098 RepID=A0A1Y2DT79_9PEZI|nr:uncharacterized protein BCR38DRAFT_410778 [Pseudomassariella vexata]ORY62354.1 hypothetical protein BCR38DRAFT_410778 [Pseudomassariella vexata]
MELPYISQTSIDELAGYFETLSSSFHKILAFYSEANESVESSKEIGAMAVSALGKFGGNSMDDEALDIYLNAVDNANYRMTSAMKAMSKEDAKLKGGYRKFKENIYTMYGKINAMRDEHIAERDRLENWNRRIDHFRADLRELVWSPETWKLGLSVMVFIFAVGISSSLFGRI